DSVGEHEGPLELSRCDAAIEILPGLVVLLPPADDELAFLDGHLELLPGEAGHREGDPEPFGIAAFARQPLDVVRRIAVGSLGNAIERSLDLVEAKQKRAGKRRHSGHGCKALDQRLCRGPDGRPDSPYMGSSGQRFKNTGVSKPLFGLPEPCRNGRWGRLGRAGYARAHGGNDRGGRSVNQADGGRRLLATEEFQSSGGPCQPLSGRERLEIAHYLDPGRWAIGL